MELQPQREAGGKSSTGQNTILTVTPIPAEAKEGDHQTGPPESQSLPSLTSDEEQKEENPSPPDGGYAHLITLASFLANANTWGVNASWGIFLAHFLSSSTSSSPLFPGVTKLQFALVGGLSIAQALLIAPLVLACQRRFGARLTVTVGAMVMFAGLFGAGDAAMAGSIGGLVASQGLGFGWGMGFIYIPATEVLPHWFSARRSLAVGIATSGSGLGGLAYTLITERIIAQLGVRWAYRILALCTLVLNLACAGMLREWQSSTKRRNESEVTVDDDSVDETHQEGKQGKTKRSIATKMIRKGKKVFQPLHFSRIEVLLVILWGFATDMGYIALLYSLPTYATSIGLSPSQGSMAQALLNLGLGLGRPCVGWASDRVGRINMALGMTLCCGLLIFGLWIPARSYPALLTFGMLVGVVCGTFWATVSPVLAEVVELFEMGRILGSVCLALVLPSIFAEVVAMQLVKSGGEEGQSRDGAGQQDFLPSQVFVGCMFIAGALSLFVLRSWKMGQVDKKTTRGTRNAVMMTTAPGSDFVSFSSSGSERLWLTPRKAFRLIRV